MARFGDRRSPEHRRALTEALVGTFVALVVIIALHGALISWAVLGVLFVMYFGLRAL